MSPPPPCELDAVMKLEVPIIVRIAEQKIPIEEVVGWVPGLIIEMGCSADEPLNLMVNNVPIARGTPVKIGENFGICISYVGDLRAKIEAMSGRQVYGQQPSSSPSPTQPGPDAAARTQSADDPDALDDQQPAASASALS